MFPRLKTETSKFDSDFYRKSIKSDDCIFRSVRQTKRELSEEDSLFSAGQYNGSLLGRRIRNSALPRLLETPVRLITQSSLSLSLPKLYNRLGPVCPQTFCQCECHYGAHMMTSHRCFIHLQLNIMESQYFLYIFVTWLILPAVKQAHII